MIRDWSDTNLEDFSSQLTFPLINHRLVTSYILSLIEHFNQLGYAGIDLHPKNVAVTTTPDGMVDCVALKNFGFHLRYTGYRETSELKRKKFPTLYSPRTVDKVDLRSLGRLIYFIITGDYLEWYDIETFPSEELAAIMSDDVCYIIIALCVTPEAGMTAAEMLEWMLPDGMPAVVLEKDENNNE